MIVESGSPFNSQQYIEYRRAIAQQAPLSQRGLAGIFGGSLDSLHSISGLNQINPVTGNKEANQKPPSFYHELKHEITEWLKIAI